MEDVLVPFVQAFRALPAVVMDEIGRVGDVVVRQRMFDGKSYFYVVNTSDLSQSLDLVFPQGSVDLVSGERLNGGQSLNLKAYEFRSFSAPSGKPILSF
jgi:beta-galactosidase GanA